MLLRIIKRYTLLVTALCSLLTPCLAKEQNADKQITHLLREAIVARNAQQIDVAMEYCQHALLIDSTNASVHFELFQLYAMCNSHEQAFGHLKKATNQDPNNKYYNEFIAYYYEGFNQLDSAIAVTVRLLHNNPHNESYLLKLSNLYSKTKNYKDALTQYDKLEKISTNDAGIAYMRLSLKIDFAKESPQKLTREAKRCVKKYPEDARFAFLLGNLYEKQRGKLEESCRCYAQSIKTNPFYTKPYKPLANNLLWLGRTNDYKRYLFNTIKSDVALSTKLDVMSYMPSTDTAMVVEAFDSLLLKHPDNAGVYASYAECLLFYNDTTQAMAYLNKSLEYDPQNEDLWMLLLNYTHNHSLESYSNTLDEAIKYNPKSPVLRYNKGIYNLQQGNYTDALNDISEAITLTSASDHQTLSGLWCIKGSLLQDLKRTEEAYEAYEYAIAYNKNNHLALNNFAYLLAINNIDIKRAEALSSEAIKLAPTVATYLDTYAWILYLQGEYTLARFYIEKAVARDDGQFAEIYDHYGDILVQKGESQKAIEAYTKAAELDATYQEAMKQKINNCKE